MIVKLKYSVGDEVWIMLGNRPQRVKIHSIVISCYKGGTYYSYKCELPNGKIYSKNSYQVFKTKKELIKSL